MVESLERSTVMLSVDGLQKEYRAGWSRQAKVALAGVSFKVPEGSIVGLVGRNGAGKTTTLRLLIGHERKDHGEILWSQGDRPSTVWLPESEVFDPGLQPAAYLSVLCRDVDRDRTARLAERLHVTEHLRRCAGELSAGQRRRCGLLLVLAARASLVLLDEPVIGVDPVELEAVKEVVRQRQAEGATVIISTHLLREFDDLVDYLVMLDEGRVLYSGSRIDLCEGIQVGVLDGEPPDWLRQHERRGSLCLRASRVILPDNGQSEELLAELSVKGVAVTPSRATIHDGFLWRLFNADRLEGVSE